MQVLEALALETVRGLLLLIFLKMIANLADQEKIESCLKYIS